MMRNLGQNKRVIRRNGGYWDGVFARKNNWMPFSNSRFSCPSQHIKHFDSEYEAGYIAGYSKGN